MIIIFFLFIFNFLFGSDISDPLHEDHWQNIQEQMSYADLINLSYVNKKYNKLFNGYITERLKNDIFECFYTSPLLQYFIDRIIRKGWDIIFLEEDLISKNDFSYINKTINECLKYFYSKPLDIDRFANTPLYKKYVAEIRKNDDSKNVVQEKIKNYIALLSGVIIPHTRLSREQKAIIIFESDKNIIIDIPDTSKEDIIKQLLAYSFNHENTFSLVFGNLETNPFSLNDLLSAINNIFPLDKILLIDLSRCKKIETIKNINVTLFNNNILIKVKRHIMQKLISDLCYGSDKNEVIFNMLLYCIDTTRSNLDEYACGIKGLSRKEAAKVFPFFAEAYYAKKFIQDKHSQRDSENKILLSIVTPENILEELLKNMLYTQKQYAQDTRCDPIKYFCPVFMEHINPRYLWPYLSELEKKKSEAKKSNITRESILERAERNGFKPFLNWIRESCKKHIEKHGFNLQERIIDYILKKCFP